MGGVGRLLGSRIGRWALPLGVFVVALAILVVASRYTAPAFDELAVASSIGRAESLVKDVARNGATALGAPEAKILLNVPAAPLVLLGAWSKLSIGRLGVLDPLTAMRLPWLVLGALACSALFSMLHPSRGLVLALVAPLVLLLLPRWLHAVVVGREGALVGSCWLLVLAGYVKSLGPTTARGERRERRMLTGSVLGAVGLGVGAALSLATLWVLLPMTGHYALSRWRRTRRLARQGRIPAPALVLFALPLGPALVYALSPPLWKGTPAVIARFFLAPLGPNVTRADYAGRVVESAPVPAGFASSWLVSTLPLVVSVAAVVGIGALLHHGLARRFASGRLRPAADRHAVSLLALLCLGAAVVGPTVAPPVLTTFPPRIEIALPFVAVLATLGLDAVARVSPRPRVAHAAVVVVVASLLPTLFAASTASASFTPLFGGAERVAATRMLPVGDGSEIGALLRDLDRELAGSPALAVPRDVPPDFWRVLNETGRLRAAVVPTPSARLALVRGAPTEGRTIASVRRDGALLWSLVAR